MAISRWPQKPETSHAHFSSRLLTGKEQNPDYVQHNSENATTNFVVRAYNPYRARFIERDPYLLERESFVGHLAYAIVFPNGKVDPLGKQEGEMCSSELLCGPDATDALKALMKRIEAHWNGFSAEQRSDICDGLMDPLTAPGAWEINELFSRRTKGENGQGSPSNADMFLEDYKPCATPPPCDLSLWVGGKCWYTGSLNYLLFGKLGKLCNWNKAFMYKLITLWKGPLSAPIDFYGNRVNLRSASGNYYQSASWAGMGYDGWGTAELPIDAPGLDDSRSAACKPCGKTVDPKIADFSFYMKGKSQKVYGQGGGSERRNWR
jgi:hypothetical protein